MPSLRQAGRGDDCSGALADAATTEDMVLAEQRSEAALPQAVPGPSTAREAAAAAQTPFEPDVHGQGDERRDLPARSRDDQGLGPNKRPRLDPSEDDTPPNFEDTCTILGRSASRMEQLTEAAVCQRAAELFPSDAAVPAARPALPPVVETPTNELARLAFAASKEVKLVRGKLAREEAAGYIAADLLGIELLQGEALRLGESVRRAALKLGESEAQVKKAAAAKRSRLRSAAGKDAARAVELEAALQQLESETEAACAEMRRKPIDLKGLPEKNTEIAVARPRPPKPKPEMSSDAVCNEVWGSRQATCAIRDAKQLQRCLAYPLELDDDGNYDCGSTEEETELAVAKYTYSVKQLAAAFPKLELDVDALVKGVPCNNYNSEPCECGLGRVGLFPWEVWTKDLGFCKCELAKDHDESLTGLCIY